MEWVSRAYFFPRKHFMNNQCTVQFLSKTKPSNTPSIPQSLWLWTVTFLALPSLVSQASFISALSSNSAGKQKQNSSSGSKLGLICTLWIIQALLIPAPAPRQEACEEQSLLCSRVCTSSVTTQTLCSVTKGFRSYIKQWKWEEKK